MVDLDFIKKNKKLVSLGLSLYNRICIRNHFCIYKRKENKISINCVLLKKVKMSVYGLNNQVIIEDYSILQNCTFHISGNNNKIIIRKRCNIANAEFWIEDSNNIIEIGEHTRIHGPAHLATIEGTKIEVGDESLISGGTQFRTGDSHSILDADNCRINKSEDIIIGKHCWIGNSAICLKGIRISDNSIVGAGSVVTGKFVEKNVILAGNPAKIIKREINWDNQRI